MKLGVLYDGRGFAEMRGRLSNSYLRIGGAISKREQVVRWMGNADGEGSRGGKQTSNNLKVLRHKELSSRRNVGPDWN